MLKKSIGTRAVYCAKGGCDSGVGTCHRKPSPSNYGVDPLMGQQAVIVPQTLQIQEENAQMLLEEVKESLKDIADDISCFHRTGSPRQEILAVSIEWGADLIIMGTHGRTGFDHFISGSVSESVLRRANCPVLIIPGKC